MEIGKTHIPLIIILLLLIIFSIFLKVTNKQIHILKEQIEKQLNNYNKCIETFDECIEILDEAHEQLEDRKIRINQLRTAVCYYNGVGVGPWWKDVPEPCQWWWMHRSWDYNRRDNCDSSLWLNCEINIKP